MSSYYLGQKGENIKNPGHVLSGIRMSTSRDRRSVSLVQRKQGEAEEFDGGQLIRSFIRQFWKLWAAGHIIRFNVILHCRDAWRADSRHISYFNNLTQEKDNGKLH